MRVRTDRPLLAGDAGTAQTVAEMRALAHEGARHPAVRSVAGWCEDVARSLEDRPRSRRSKLPAVIRHVCERIEFLSDDDAAAELGVGGRITELVRAPWLVLTDGVGDCDDVATLGASIALALGIRARFVTVGPPGSGFIHVYAEIMCCPSGGWTELDTTRDVQGLPSNWRDWRRRVWPL